MRETESPCTVRTYVTRDVVGDVALGVVAKVDDIAYTLDLVACAEWRLATSPGHESRALRRSLKQ